MCTVTVAQETLDCLGVKVSNSEIFTAFDVTLAARKATSETVLLKDVRDIVVNEFRTGAMGNYNRDPVELDVTNNPVVLVYYPHGKSPYDHPLAIKPAAPALDADDDDELEDAVGSGSTDSDVYTIAAGGRINIAKTLLDKVDATGGSYDIEINGTLHCRKPEKDGRVRLGVAQRGISSKKVRVTVDVSANKITLEAV